MIRTLLENKHTSIAAGAYVAAKLIAGLGTIWLPHYKDQFDQSMGLIESIAVAYGFVMAGDAKKPAPTP